MVVPTPVGRPECYREQSGLTGVLPTLEIEYSVTTVAPAQPFPKLGENDRTGMHATVAYTSNNLPDAGHAAAQDTACDAYRNRTRTLAQRGSGPNAYIEEMHGVFGKTVFSTSSQWPRGQLMSPAHDPEACCLTSERRSTAVNVLVTRRSTEQARRCCGVW